MPLSRLLYPLWPLYISTAVKILVMFSHFFIHNVLNYFFVSKEEESRVWHLYLIGPIEIYMTILHDYCSSHALKALEIPSREA